MKLLTRLGWLLALLLLGVAISIATLRAGLWNPSYAMVKSKYATPPSQFLDVGGVSVHLRDEGHGPALVILHSSQTNLRIWDDWVDVLKANYRVIRVDWPPYGLTVDNSGQYSMANAASAVGRWRNCCAT